MKIVETEVESFEFGTQETSVAKIQASAKAFEILSSSLYSNGPLAIIRELCANAKDSHTAAGKPTEPFRVQIPNTLDPQFIVRDYGVGMDHQFMMTRVNTYFDSTKNESNTEIGGFGLGIKSVFSYTTSFMIACYDGEVRRVYSYKIGASGLPEISFQAETPSTEPKGVEVSVPVKNEDFEVFQSNAIEALTFYNPRPEVVGIGAERFAIEQIYAGKTWSVYRNPGLLSGESYVEMGDVIYPIPDGHFDDSQWGRSQRSTYNSYNRNRNTVVVVYKAGIGQIDITPNREQIKLSDKSKAQIAEFEKTVKQELGKQIQDFINTFKCTYWELSAQDKIRELLRSSVLQKFGVDPKKLKYRGLSLDPHMRISYTGKEAAEGLTKKIKAVNTLSINYESVNIRKAGFDQHYGIQFTADNRPTIIVCPVGTSKTITAAQLNSKYGNRFNLYTMEAAEADHAAIVADINKVIPDFAEHVVLWDTIKDELAKIKEPDRYIKYDFINDRYGNNSPTEFNESDFDGITQLYYELQSGDGDGYGRYSRYDSKLSGLFHYIPEEVSAKFKAVGIESAYALSKEQLATLRAKGIKATVFTTAIDKVLREIAVEFANSRPTMELKAFMKPITDLNPRICLTTHYKAVKRWIKETGDLDLLKLLQAMDDESTSSYRHSAEDRLFRAVTKKGVKEYIVAKKIVPTKLTTNDVIKNLVAKAPLCARLVSDYTAKDVLEYIKASNFHTAPVTAVVAAPAKPKRKKPASARSTKKAATGVLSPFPCTNIRMLDIDDVLTNFGSNTLIMNAPSAD